jgi:3',5'-cyclic AMP phosphodiesterase CpdA
VFSDAEMMVVGLNSARSVPMSGAGRLNEAQVERAVEHFASAPPGLMKIVVTHHPFELPDGHGDRHLIGRSQMAMGRLAQAGADLFLAGHLHVSHVGNTAGRYKIEGHSALVVQAGTLSTRERGEAGSFNVVRLQRPSITVERYAWSPMAQAFSKSWAGEFRHTPDGWM